MARNCDLCPTLSWRMSRSVPSRRRAQPPKPVPSILICLALHADVQTRPLSVEMLSSDFKILVSCQYNILVPHGVNAGNGQSIKLMQQPFHIKMFEEGANYFLFIIMVKLFFFMEIFFLMVLSSSRDPYRFSWINSQSTSIGWCIILLHGGFNYSSNIIQRIHDGKDSPIPCLEKA